MKTDLFNPYNFAGLAPKYTNLDTAKAVILPVPYEYTLSYKSGTREGPRAIINASRYVELYDDELNKNTFEMGIHTLEELEPDLERPEKMLERIYTAAVSLLKQEKFLVTLGGEHSISLGLVKAYSEQYGDLSVLQLDAHADLIDAYWGTKYSHAAVMRRIRDHASGVHVGIRHISQPEMFFVQQNKIPLYYARDIVGRDDWIGKMIGQLSPHVYLTFDLDVFDPGIMPAVGTPEPGGLGWYEVLNILREVCRQRHIVGFDVVELSPLPGNIAPDFMAAKLVYKLLGYCLR